MSGSRRTAASALAEDTPTSSAPISPGPWVTATRVEVPGPHAGALQGVGGHGVHELEMAPRGQLGHHAAVALVQQALRRDRVGEHVSVAGHHGGAGVVAARLDREDQCLIPRAGVAHDTADGQDQPGPQSMTVRFRTAVLPSLRRSTSFRRWAPAAVRPKRTRPPLPPVCTRGHALAAQEHAAGHDVRLLSRLLSSNRKDRLVVQRAAVPPEAARVGHRQLHVDPRGGEAARRALRGPDGRARHQLKLVARPRGSGGGDRHQPARHGVPLAVEPDRDGQRLVPDDDAAVEVHELGEDPCVARASRCPCT